MNKTQQIKPTGHILAFVSDDGRPYAEYFTTEAAMYDWLIDSLFDVEECAERNRLAKADYATATLKSWNTLKDVLKERASETGMKWDIRTVYEKDAAVTAAIKALKSALERTEGNLTSAIRSRPVRDLAENLAENKHAFDLASACA